jgi:hypothetical protein
MTVDDPPDASDIIQSQIEPLIQEIEQLQERLLSLTVEAGGVGLRGYYMAMPRLNYWGPIHDDEVYLRQKLTDFSADAVNSVLLAIFEQFFDACAAKRPDHFNGFPPPS